MKTFIKILKITALVVSAACVLFVLYIFVILNLLFSSDTPEGCDPSMPTSACDYIDEKFEKELQNLPPGRRSAAIRQKTRILARREKIRRRREV